ncbi:hypothetical protein [Streptomyces sp. NPDC002521]
MVLRPPVEPMLAQARDQMPPPGALPGGLVFQPQTVTRLEQQAVGLKASLEEREAELEAAREANRQLTRALNQRE